MEGLYFEVKPKRELLPMLGSSDKPCRDATSNLDSCPTLLHHTSSRPGPGKLVSERRKRAGISREKVVEEEEGEEEVQYKLTLIGSLPVHHMTTMTMLPWVVAQIMKSQASEKEMPAGSPRGGQSDPLNQTLMCVSASGVKCVSIFGDGVVWDPLTHTVLFECRPQQVTKLIHNSQEPSSFGCLVRDSVSCACYVFRCLDSTKVCVCVLASALGCRHVINNN